MGTVNLYESNASVKKKSSYTLASVLSSVRTVIVEFIASRVINDRIGLIVATMLQFSVYCDICSPNVLKLMVVTPAFPAYMEISFF